MLTREYKMNDKMKKTVQALRKSLLTEARRGGKRCVHLSLSLSLSLIQNVLDTSNTVAGRDTGGMIPGKTGRQINFIVRRQESLAA